MQDVLPPPTANGEGFERTRVRQFTIFLDNRVGRLQALVRAIEDAAITICAISIEESADAALVRLILSDADAGRAALQGADFSFTESELLAVEISRRSKHPLSNVCTALLAAEINIHYTYPLLARPRGPALALYVEDPTLAAQILIRKGYTLLAEADLRKKSEG